MFDRYCEFNVGRICLLVHISSFGHSPPVSFLKELPHIDAKTKESDDDVEQIMQAVEEGRM